MRDGHDEHEIQIEKLIYGGEALGRLPDGRAVFVPYAMPGEIVRLRVVDHKRTYARADLVDVLQHSPDRVPARCQHFTTCGGCHYQHFAYTYQWISKTNIVIDQLKRIAGLESPPVETCSGAGAHWGYRNQMQFHLHASGEIGFQRWRSNEVIPVQECHLPQMAIQTVWKQLRFAPDSGIQRVVIRDGSRGNVLIVLEGGSADSVDFPADIPASIVHQTSNEYRTIRGSSTLIYLVLGREFKVSASSFFQTNLAVAEVMVSHLLENFPVNEDSTLLELYSGVGLFSAFLASQVGRLIAVESSPSACDDFVVNLAEFENVELYQDSAENVLSVWKDPVDALLVDPPRAGLSPRVMDAILQKIQPGYIAYVSCDPATLARDAKKLEAGGYRLIKICPFDMFPQTFHIESISYWERP